MSNQDKAIFLTYCVSLSQLLIEAIDAIEQTNQQLFKQDFKRLAKKFRAELLKRIDLLYSNNTRNEIQEDAELQFYDFTSLLELQLHLIMQMNETERSQLAELLISVQKRLKEKF